MIAPRVLVQVNVRRVILLRCMHTRPSAARLKCRRLLELALLRPLVESELNINQTMRPRSVHHRGLSANQSLTPAKHGAVGGQVAEEHAHERSTNLGQERPPDSFCTV